MDRVGKPLYMKTYGRNVRKLDAWISPDNRRELFNTTSSSSSTSGLPIDEPITLTGRKRSNGKKSNAASRHGVRKAMECVRKEDSDQEDSFIPSAPPMQQQQNKPLRKGHPVSKPPAGGPTKRKAPQSMSSSESEGDSGKENSAAKRPRRSCRRKRHPESNKKTNAARRSGVRQAKAKAMECLRMEDSDQEDSFIPSSPPMQQQQNKPPRKGPLSKPPAGGPTRRKAQQSLSTSESEGDSRKENSAAKHPKDTVCRRKRPGPAAVSLGRFVTDRRRGATTRAKVPKSTLNALMPLHSLNSSDDFVPAGGRRKCVALPRRANLRRPRELSSAESSVVELGNTSSTNVYLREISSLDTSAEPNLGPCHRKPLFCSTPSLHALARPRLPPHRRHHPDHSPSVSVIDVNNLITTQEEMEIDPSILCISTPAPVGKLSPGVKQLLDLGEPPGEPGRTNGEESPQLGVTRPRSCRRSLNGETKSQNEGAEVQNDCFEQLSPELFPPAADKKTDSDSCHFISAAGRLERLENLKKMCATRRCVVPLERVDKAGDATQPQGETTYSSCLDHACSARSELPEEERAAGSSERSASAACGRSPDRSGDDGVESRSANSGESVSHTSDAVESVDRSFYLSLSATDVDGRSIDQSADAKAWKVRSDDRGRPETVLEKTRDGVPAKADADEAPVDVPVPVPTDVPKARKTSAAAPKGKKRRSASRDRPGTTRKACVSGLSVSRWSRADGAAGGVRAHALHGRAGRRAPPTGKAGDCSITELLSTRHIAQAEAPGSALCTPMRGVQGLHMSFLLQDLSPDTHTWSRLKAALSVHKKTKVFLTPYSNAKNLSLGGARLADVSQDLFASPLPRRLQSQLQESVLSAREDGLSDAEKVYAECGQQGVLGWEACLPPKRMKLCKKIGEGTFGEVFSTANSAGDTVALKIIPVEGSEKVNGEDQKTFGEILHEIIISKELSSLKNKPSNQTQGFIGLNDLHCVRGRYPPGLLKAWDAFDSQRCSENDRPDFFEDNQLFLILEFEFGGSDLENSNGKLSSLAVAKSIVHQVTAALAVAEQELHFEHRDLHWGNVLVKQTKEKEGHFLLNGVSHRLNTRGVHVRIIDYSLSRLEIDGLTVSCDISEDEELFMGQGDYQFDIYRLMRQENSNDWSVYQPYSNVLWLHYLCSKLLAMKFKGAGRGVRQTREDLSTFHDQVLQYRSATEVLHSCALFAL